MRITVVIVTLARQEKTLQITTKTLHPFVHQSWADQTNRDGPLVESNWQILDHTFAMTLDVQHSNNAGKVYTYYSGRINSLYKLKSYIYKAS